MWLKVHLMCGVKTNIVTSVEISDGYAHDYHFFKGPVSRTGESGFNMKEVSADKAYLGGENLLVTLRHGAIPYIPFKSNSQVQSTYGAKSELWTRMFHFYNLHREEFLEQSLYPSPIISAHSSSVAPHSRSLALAGRTNKKAGRNSGPRLRVKLI